MSEAQHRGTWKVIALVLALVLGLVLVFAASVIADIMELAYSLL